VDLGIKVLTRDNLRDSISLNDPKFDSNFGHNFFMVSRNNASVGTALIKIIHNLSNSLPELILKAKGSNEA